MIAIHKQKMINELIQKLNSWNEYSEKIYGYSKKDAEIFLKRLQVGVYNSVLKNSFWFANIPFLDTLIQLEITKKELNSFTNINEENYIVYSAIHDIKDHLKYIYYWHKAYKKNYHTPINNYEQPPATKEEYEEFKNLYSNVINKNYTWYEARKIVNNIEKLNIKENEYFPHNINKIKNIFNPQLDLLFKSYSQKVKYSTNILNLNSTTNNLLNKLKKETLLDFLKDIKTNPYEEYIRQVLLATNTKDIEKAKYILNTLLTPKKIIDLSKETIPQPYLTTLRKHYNFIFQYTTEIEFLEESIEILNNLITIYSASKDKLYEITIIYNMILISYGIIPIPLTENILNMKEQKVKTIIDKTIEQAEYFNNKNQEI